MVRPQVLVGWFAGCRVTLTEHLQCVDAQPSLEAWWEAMWGVPVLERLRATLPDRDFQTFRREVIRLRARFAGVTTDGTVTAYNRYVRCSVEPEQAET